MKNAHSNLIVKCKESFQDLFKASKQHDLIDAFLDGLNDLNLDSALKVEFKNNHRELPLTVDSFLEQLNNRTDKSRKLDSHLSDISQYLDWYQIFDGPGIEKNLAEGLYAAQIIGKRGLIKSPNLLMGLFLLAPGIYYPLHQHDTLEIYYVYSGNIKIQYGREKEPFQVNPGEFSITPNNQVHSLQTGVDACLISYIWIPGGGDLLSPNWWWEEQADSSWDRICWERKADSSWEATGRQKLTAEIASQAGDGLKN